MYLNILIEKAKKLKQAKDEAKSEIQVFTKEQETQFKVSIIKEMNREE